MSWHPLSILPRPGSALARVGALGIVVLVAGLSLMPNLAVPDAAPGRVHWAPMHPAEANRAVVAEMGSGCMCCGAIWPEPRLELGDDVLAFNYADPDGFAAIGIVRRTCP